MKHFKGVQLELSLTDSPRSNTEPFDPNTNEFEIIDFREAQATYLEIKRRKAISKILSLKEEYPQV